MSERAGQRGPVHRAQVVEGWEAGVRYRHGMARAGGLDAESIDSAQPRVRVFGDPSLVARDGVLDVNGHAGRLLAALAAARTGLHVDDLIDALWPIEPPNSARSALHVHLSRLRRLLDEMAEPDRPAAGERPSIERHGAHYRLDLGGAVLDVDLFESLRRRALPLVSADPEGALALMERALELAVGPAFTVDGESVDPSATDHVQLALLDLAEEHVECLLALDRLLDAERAGLELINADPYRERRWAQVMRAQGLCGRRHDALATFRRARVELVNGLGIEPGEELQRLQLAVLADDTAALLGASEVTEIESVLPPSSLGPLIGREREVAETERIMARRVPLVVLGAPGVGKTRLASEVGFRAADRTEVHWVDLRSSAFTSATVAATEAERWARQHPSGMLIVDNAESDVALADRIVEVASRVAPSLQILVTSRLPLRRDAATLVLQPLALPADVDEAIEASAGVRLLRSLLELRAPGAVIDSRAAAALVRAVGGLPLGIRLIADMARTAPAGDILDRSSSTVAAQLGPAVEAVLAALGDDAVAAFHALSFVPGQLDRALVAALIGPTFSDRLLASLCDVGLVQFDPSRPAAQYSMLEPVRDVASTLLARSGRHDDVAERLVDECFRRSRGFGLPTESPDVLRSAAERLDRELPLHRQAIGYLAGVGHDEPALRLVVRLELPLYMLGWWATLTALQSSALAIAGQPGKLRALVHVMRGRPGPLHAIDAEHEERARAMAVELGDSSTQARAVSMLGLKAWWEGDHPRALDLLHEARLLAQGSGLLFAELDASRFIGVTLVSAGEHERGLALQLETLERAETTPGMEAFVPHLRMFLGHSRRSLGQSDVAWVSLDSSREAFERTSNVASLIHVYAGLAEIAADHGDGERALRLAGRGLELAALGGLRDHDGWLACTIARVHAAAGDVPAARAAAGEAIAGVTRGWVGETSRVAGELSFVAMTVLDDPVAVARLVGLAQATPDRRELPFTTPAERERVAAARSFVANSLPDGGHSDLTIGAGSTLAEAAAALTSPWT